MIENIISAAMDITPRKVKKLLNITLDNFLNKNRKIRDAMITDCLYNLLFQ